MNTKQLIGAVALALAAGAAAAGPNGAQTSDTVETGLSRSRSLLTCTSRNAPASTSSATTASTTTALSSDMPGQSTLGCATARLSKRKCAAWQPSATKTLGVALPRRLQLTEPKSGSSKPLDAEATHGVVEAVEVRLGGSGRGGREQERVHVTEEQGREFLPFSWAEYSQKAVKQTAGGA